MRWKEVNYFFTAFSAFTAFLKLFFSQKCDAVNFFKKCGEFCGEFLWKMWWNEICFSSPSSQSLHLKKLTAFTAFLTKIQPKIWKRQKVNYDFKIFLCGGNNAAIRFRGYKKTNDITGFNDCRYPGLDLDSWKDNARQKCAMKRPYWTHLSYEKTLAGL